MYFRLLNIVSLLLMLVGYGSAIGQGSEVPPEAGGEAAVVDTNEQLEINREALLRGSTEQIRVKAASLILSDTHPQARQILLKTLQQADNVGAVTAVCKALSQTHTQEKSVPKPEQFLEPVMNLLTRSNGPLGAVAAEACQFFDFDTIGPALTAVVMDTEKPTPIRLNMLAVLEQQPDKRAVFVLLDLVDDPDEQVAAQAYASLQALGIEDAGDRRAIVAELKRKSKDAFLQDYVLGQEKRIAKERQEAESWRLLYLESLDRLYGALTDDNERGAFLTEHLTAPQAERRRWALAKAYEWRMAAGSNLPETMSPVLLGLIADEDRAVRLSTARLLSKMGDGNSAQALLNRLDVEQDDEVRSALFVALGMACDFALMEGAGGNISLEVKRKTLDWASQFLAQPDPNQIREGADVISKLLAKNGLTVDVVHYLELLKNRYLSPDMQPNEAGRADLIGAMAGLCLPRSACRAQAVRLFSPLFAEARSDANDRIRQNAVEGLFNVDKSGALQELRTEYHSDSSAAIRYLLMEAAAEVGEMMDLDWLVQRLTQGQDRPMAWQAISGIAGRQNAEPLAAWLKGVLATDSALTIDQAISLLQAVERKAGAEKKAAVRAWSLRELANRQRVQGDTEAAIRSLTGLREVQPRNRQADLLGEILLLYLESGQIQPAAKLIQGYLTGTDVKDGGPIVGAIEAYRGGGAEQEAQVTQLVDSVENVALPASRPHWNRYRDRWLQSAEPAETPPDSSPTEAKD